MNTVATQKYLRQVERLDRMIQNKLSEIYQLKVIATSVTVAQKDVNVQTSGDKDLIGSTVAKIVDLERETDMLVDEYIDKRKKIISQIESLEDTDVYNVLAERYIARRSWDDIETSMDMSHRYLMAVHKRALKEFEERFGREYL